MKQLIQEIVRILHQIGDTLIELLMLILELITGVVKLFIKILVIALWVIR